MASLPAVSDVGSSVTRSDAPVVAVALEGSIVAPPTITAPAAMAVPERRILWRLIWAGLFLAPVAVVITAALLTPNPLGHGTHMQLGLPPCGFLVITGYPCPGCGLTTAFSNMAHFNIVAAAHANPFGIPLFLTTVCMIPIALAGVIRGAHVLDTLEIFQADKIAILLACTSVLTWTVRIATLLLS